MTPFLTTFTCSHFYFPIHGNYFVTYPQHSISQIVLFLCKAWSRKPTFVSISKNFHFLTFFYFLRTTYSQKPCIFSYSHNFQFLLSFAFYIAKSTFVSLFHNLTFLRMFLLNVVGGSFISNNNFSHLRLCPVIFVTPPVE